MKPIDEVAKTEFPSVEDYFGAIPKLITREHTFGFRGHADEEWDLAPTFARFVDKIIAVYPKRALDREGTTKSALHKLRNEFRRNLIVNNDVPRQRIEEMDIWQYGQHFGLPSPLLDWTRSPYVALFFSVWEREGGNRRCVWIINLDLLRIVNDSVIREIRPRFKDKFSEDLLNQQFPTLETVEEISELNRRMVFQQGFFTKHDHYRSFQVWIKRITAELPQKKADRALLHKHTFACSENQRLAILDKLDAMNINHRTLFPDITGSVLDAVDATMRSFQAPQRQTFSFSA